MTLRTADRTAWAVLAAFSAAMCVRTVIDMPHEYVAIGMFAAAAALNAGMARYGTQLQ